MNDQVELVSAQLNSIRELQGGFDAMGLSQGINSISSRETRDIP